MDPTTPITLQGLITEFEAVITHMRSNRDLAQAANYGLQHPPSTQGSPAPEVVKPGSPTLIVPVIPRLVELLAEARSINNQVEDHLHSVNRSVG